MQIFMKISPVGAESGNIQTYGRTGGHDEALVAFPNTANAPTSWRCQTSQ